MDNISTKLRIFSEERILISIKKMRHISTNNCNNNIEKSWINQKMKTTLQPSRIKKSLTIYMISQRNS